MKIIAAHLALCNMDYSKLADHFGLSRTLIWMAVKGQRTSDQCLKIRSYVDKLVADKGSPTVIIRRKN